MSATTPDDGTQTAADHGYEHGQTLLGRRDFAKALGATTAIGATGAASSGTVRAEGLVDGVVSTITGAATSDAVMYGVAASGGPAGLVGLVGVKALDAALNKSPSADQTILHNLTSAEFESLTAHEATFSNRLTDLPPVASLDARNGIASAWEDDENASTAYNRAMSLIRQVFELPEFNHYHVTNKSLLQLSYVAGAAVDTDYPDWVAATGTDGSDNNVQIRMIDDRQEVDIDLHDGTSISNVDVDDSEAEDVGENPVLKVPMVELRDTTASDLESEEALIDTVPILSQDVVDSWDSENEEVTLTASDETAVTTNLRFVQPNVGDPEDGGLASTRVFDGVEFFKILEEIWTESDNATANYSQSFVEDIYAELDAGNLTPTQVRSAEGQARWLSGTDDPSQDRFRLAMLQEFGMEQPDFSLIAQMSVNWSGATDSSVDPDPDLSERYVHPEGFVDGQSYRGALFSNKAPDGGFQSGESYLIDPSLHVADQSGDLHSIGLEGQIGWQTGSFGTQATAVGTSTDGQTVYVGDGSPTLTAVDVTDGSEVWSDTNTYDSNVEAVTVAPDDTVYVSDYSGDVYEVDPEDGSATVFYTNSSGGRIASLEFPPDTSKILLGAGDGVMLVNRSDGEDEWTLSLSERTDDIAVTSDGSKAFAADSMGTVHAVLMSDGTEDWTHSTPNTAGYQSVIVSKDDSTVFVGESNNGSLWSLAAADGSENYEESFSSEISALYHTGEPGKILVGSGSQLIAFDPENQETIWTYSSPSDDVLDISMMEPAGTSGIAGSSLIFDESSDPAEETTLSNGVIEITEMTDSEGATITHVSDQTIADIEALEGTPDSIDTIVSEMDEFDSADDIEYTRDVQTILEFYEIEASVGEDDASDITVSEPDYERPEYDSYSSQEWAEYIKTVEDYQEQLEAEEEAGGGIFGSELNIPAAGLVFAIAAVILAFLGGSQS